jgi:predicted dehydrogenase
MHLFYQSVYLLGVPRALTAMTARRHHAVEGEDVASVLMQYGGGAIAHVLQSWVSNDGSPGAAPVYCPTVRVLGTRATLTVSDALYLDRRKAGRVAPRPETFSRMLACFVRCVRGKGEPLSGLAEAGQCLRLVRAAYTSARRGRTVRL